MVFCNRIWITIILVSFHFPDCGITTLELWIIYSEFCLAMIIDFAFPLCIIIKVQGRQNSPEIVYDIMITIDSICIMMKNSPFTTVPYMYISVPHLLNIPK